MHSSSLGSSGISVRQPSSRATGFRDRHVLNMWQGHAQQLLQAHLYMQTEIGRGGGRGDSSSLSLPHRQGALWRHVVSLLCADCSRQRRGGCGGGWHTRLRQLGPASFCLFWKPTQALPLASRDTFPVGRVVALVPQPPACREETVQGQAWVCCIH